ncbi:MAG: TrkA C-terminal domain-containing protein [Pseudomonadota bacterium]
MSLILLGLFIILSYTIVKLGGIALELTGLPQDVARFQALSAFSSTGFTTRESEMILHHPKRRKIITYLIILGNAGIVSVLATFIVSLGGGKFSSSGFTILTVIGVVALINFLSRFARFNNGLNKWAKRKLTQVTDLQYTNLEQLLNQKNNYGIVKLTVDEFSPLAGKTLMESGLRERKIMVLSLEDSKGLMSLPPASTKIPDSCVLVCYGKLSAFEVLRKNIKS